MVVARAMKTTGDKLITVPKTIPLGGAKRGKVGSVEDEFLFRCAIKAPKCKVFLRKHCNREWRWKYILLAIVSKVIRN